MKLFVTKHIETVKYCQDLFGFSMPSVPCAKRVNKVELSFNVFTLSAL